MTRLDGTPAPANRNATIIFAFSILVYSSVFLQKLGFTIGTGSIGVNVFIMWGVLFYLGIAGALTIDPARALLFLTFFSAMMVGVLTTGVVVSLPSLILLLSLYSALIMRVEVNHETATACLAVFQRVMFIVVIIIIGQQVIQYTIGNAYWPNFNRIAPKFLLLEGYAYLRPYEWMSPYLTPNGIFFLEPSAASGFLALTVIIEIIWFRRTKRLIFLFLGLIACMAGTGPAIVALMSPVLIWKIGRRNSARIFALGLPLVLLAAWTGAVGHLTGRASEFSQQNSSGYARIVAPMNDTINLAERPEYLISGNGAGSSPKIADQVQWPANKLIYEYGIVTAVTFHIFLVIAIIGGPLSVTLATSILIPHLFFGGGFLSHVNVMLLLMFGSLLRIDRTTWLSTPVCGPSAKAALCVTIKTNAVRDTVV